MITTWLPAGAPFGRGSGFPLKHPWLTPWYAPPPWLQVPGWDRQQGSDRSADGASNEAGAREYLRTRMSSDFSMCGVLYKRVGDGGAAVATGASSFWSHVSRAATNAAVQAAISTPWQPRWFHLQGGKLAYWRTFSDFEDGKPASTVIELAGLEVLIDAADPNWGFELRPTVEGMGQRTWYV